VIFSFNSHHEGISAFSVWTQSMRSTISANSSQLCRDKVSLSDRPWMSSYIMQCVSGLWTVFWPSSNYFPGEWKWRWARYSILQVWSELEIMHGDLEQIANWVEAPRSSSKRPWSKGWNPLMIDRGTYKYKRTLGHIITGQKHVFSIKLTKKKWKSISELRCLGQFGKMKMAK
jgi:hypothetical protein